MSGTTQDLLPIAELKRQLEEHSKRDRIAADDLRTRRFAAYKALPIRWTVEPVQYRGFASDPKYEGAFVAKRTVETPEFVAEFGPLSAEDLAPRGFFYRRTDEGILTHEGGGTMVLETPRLCSDAEWQSILAGDIPEKFILKPRSL